MSNTANTARVRRINVTDFTTHAGHTGTNPGIGVRASAYATMPVYENEVVEDTDYVDEPYEGFDAAPTRVAGSQARAVALGAALLLLVIVFGAVLSLLPGQTSQQDTSKLVEGLNIGNIAPNFQMVDVRTNQPVQLTSLRGKPAFINFWGTWCPPCRQEMPEMQKVYDKYKGQLSMVGVSMAPRDTPGLVKSFVDQASYSWTFLHDADYSVATRYIVDSIPSSYFIDKDGVIKARHIGAMNVAMMEAYLGTMQVR